MSLRNGRTRKEYGRKIKNKNIVQKAKGCEGKTQPLEELLHLNGLFAAVVRDGNGNTSGSAIFEIVTGLIGYGVNPAC